MDAARGDEAVITRDAWTRWDAITLENSVFMERFMR